MKIFKSKSGYELLIPIIVLFVVILILPITNGAPLPAIATVSVTLLLTLAFILYTFLGTTYTISDDKHLWVKCGFFKATAVDISMIKSVTKTNNPIASPAPSLDRIEVHYGKYDSIIISPKDKSGFVKALQEINPDISYHPK